MIFLLKNGTITTDFLPAQNREMLTERTQLDAREVAHIMQYRQKYVNEIARLQEIDRLEALYSLPIRPNQPDRIVVPVALPNSRRVSAMLIGLVLMLVAMLWRAFR